MCDAHAHVGVRTEEYVLLYRPPVQSLSTGSLLNLELSLVASEAE